MHVTPTKSVSPGKISNLIAGLELIDAATTVALRSRIEIRGAEWRNLGESVQIALLNLGFTPVPTQENPTAAVLYRRIIFITE